MRIAGFIVTSLAAGHGIVMLSVWQITSSLVLVGGSFKIVKCTGALSFFATDHRLLAKPRTRIKFKKFSKCAPPRFHLEKLRNLTCAQKYAAAIAIRLEVFGT